MQDFGEVLADIRDRLGAPLPIRVRQTRVFCASAILVLGFLAVAMHRRMPSPDAIGLPNFDIDDDRVFQEFKELHGLNCNSIQAEQAQDLYHDLLVRLHQRNSYEMVLWRNAMQAGLFLASLAMALLMVSGFITLMTDQAMANTAVLATFIGVSVIASVICHKVYL